MTLPKMFELRQNFPDSARLDLPRLLQQQFAASGILSRVQPGMRIAVAVGSRGITNLAELVKAVLDILTGAGASPFLVPAMGSHGGATPQGQEQVLAQYGITSAAMGVPVSSSMDVRPIGKLAGGSPVVFSVPALESDGIVILNRVKPHTDFDGTIESGIFKMLTIGLGKHVGAVNAHGAASRQGYEAVIRETAQVILASAPVLCGVAILEDAHHQTAEVHVLPAAEIAAREPALLLRARSIMARLPFDEIDLLIVDEIGKEISGTGMDTNVIARSVLGYSTSLLPDPAQHPRIYRIFVRNLSATTRGNGLGIGLANFTTTRAVNALDRRYTYTNALTALSLPTANIPIYFDTDREAIEKAVTSLVAPDPEALRIVRIKNTLTLDRMLVSAAFEPVARGRPDLTLTEPAHAMEFDETGNLLPF